MNFPFTISKKLFLIFLVNSFIILMISGLVINSFSGLSSQFNYNSKLLDYKINLDIIRVEQAKLKGLAQSFYLNVTEDSIRDGVENISSSTDLILNYLKDLGSSKYEGINKLVILSNYRQAWDDKFSANANLNWYGLENIYKRGYIFDFEKEKIKLNTENNFNSYSSNISSDLNLIKSEIQEIKNNVITISKNSNKQISTLSS